MRPVRRSGIRRRGRATPALLAACKPNVRKTLKSLGADGQADVVFTSDDLGGRTSVARLRLDVRLKNCTLEYDHFPYRFTRLDGTVLFDSKTDVWTFSNLTAINGPGSFSGSGFLSEERGKSHLVLTVAGTGAALDKPLYRALPKSLQVPIVYAASVLPQSTAREAAQEFVRFLRSPDAAGIIRAKGMEPAP